MRSGWKEIAVNTVANRSRQYWHTDGVVDAMVRAATAVETQGFEAVIKALERELIKHEFVCNFDDPCDAWAA